MVLKVAFSYVAAGLLAVSSAVAPALASADEVNVYSARKEALIKPLLDQFTADTGIKVNLVTGKADALLERLKLEGRNTPADMLLTVDAGRLHRALESELLQPVVTDTLTENVPSSYRDYKGHWYGLSLRARPIVYAADRVDPATLASYEKLTDKEWEGRICIRSSSNIYNQSLAASILSASGAEATSTWAEGVVNNMARPPQGGDRDQIKAVAAGQCDIAVVNTYYLYGMLNGSDKAQAEVAKKVAIFWPNQDGRGTHVNISGAGITKAAKNKENAVKLMEFLTSDASQQWYAETNGEYPIRDAVPMSATLAEWGEFKKDALAMSELGLRNAEATRIMDKAGWR